MRRLKALRSGVYYDGRTLQPNDEFEAEDAHAAILTASGAATDATPEEAEPASYATAGMNAAKRRGYARKDMAAG